MADASQQQGSSSDVALTRLRQAIANLRADIQAIEQYLTGVSRAPATPAPSQQAVQKPAPAPGLLQLTSPSFEALRAPHPAMTTSELLYLIATQGIKTRPFDVVDTVIAPEPISAEGAEFDAGRYYDAWIVVPSVDTRISFTGVPNQNTPFVGAGQSMNFQVRARYIYYQAALPTLTGTLSLWLARYQD